MKKIIVTIGPATRSEEMFRKICNTNASFVRLNMSHASLEELERGILMAKKYSIPFMLDTEGSQIRTGKLSDDVIFFEPGSSVKVWKKEIVGNNHNINFRPCNIVEKLKKGDLVFLDFNSLMIRIEDVASLEKSGFITAKVITGGSLGNNKSAVVNQAEKSDFALPILSEKDIAAIEMGLKYGVEYIAASFIRTPQEVDIVRQKSKGCMKIISKIETGDALKNLDAIIANSEGILIDRGDLSKEVPLEKIPLIQKIVLKRANDLNKPAFVATNLLESMINSSKPTRAELNDIVTSILDGASGLALCAETAIGKYPIVAINTLSKMINEAVLVDGFSGQHFNINAYDTLMVHEYLSGEYEFSLLAKPHGGKLINRITSTDNYKQEYLNSLKTIDISVNNVIDLEQIAVGGYSPLKGFMNSKDFESVLNDMKLSDGKTIWTIPVVLDIDEATAETIGVNETIMLKGENGTIGLMRVEEKFTFNKKEVSLKWFCTEDSNHPGVAMIEKMNKILIGGEIQLLQRGDNTFKAYEMTPLQTRRIFDERGCKSIIGFQARNVALAELDSILPDALGLHNCDAIFLHTVIDRKREVDSLPELIAEDYEKLLAKFHPKYNVLHGILATHLKYFGLREIVFTAICQKNYGCSHFVIKRDDIGLHTYSAKFTVDDIFEKVGNIGIEMMEYSQVKQSPKFDVYSSEIVQH